MTSRDFQILVSLKEISELAGKTQSAVSNWRKRYEDFPHPRVESPAGTLFDLDEVERWLIESGRLQQGLSPKKVLWSLAESLIAIMSPAEISNFIIASLVYLEASDRTELPDSTLQIDESLRWTTLRQVEEESFLPELIKAAVAIESANSPLLGLLVPAFDVEVNALGNTRLSLMKQLERVLKEQGPTGLYRDAIEWRGKYDRFLDEQSTPLDLVTLMGHIVDDLGAKFFDPAVGSGILLLALAVRRSIKGEPSEYIGYELHPEVLRQARSVFFAFGATADLRNLDSLCDPSIADVQADVVVVDPPYGVSRWGTADVYTDRRWPYGSPSFNNSDFVWPQVTMLALRPGGVGLVVLPTQSASIKSWDADPLRRMIREGVVVAAVLLPARLRLNTAIPLTLWVFRRPGESSAPVDKVLVVDATKLGRSGRGQHKFARVELAEVAKLVRVALGVEQLEEPIAIPHMSVPLSEIMNGDLLMAYRDLQRPEKLTMEELRSRRQELRDGLARSLHDLNETTGRLLSRNQRENR